MATMNLVALHAALPNIMADDAELNRVLRRIGKIPEWDGAMLGAYRTSVFHNRLVVQDSDGRIVKAKPEEFRKWPSEAERVEAIRVRERQEKFAATPEGGGWVDTPVAGSNMRVWTADTSGVTNPFRQQIEQLIRELVRELVGARVDVLEEQLRDLQEQLAALTPLEIVA